VARGQQSIWERRAAPSARSVLSSSTSSSTVRADRWTACHAKELTVLRIGVGAGRCESRRDAAPGCMAVTGTHQQLYASVLAMGWTRRSRTTRQTCGLFLSSFHRRLPAHAWSLPWVAHHMPNPMQHYNCLAFSAAREDA
jgi:hypothetical protein